MGKPTGFLEYERQTAVPRDPKERVNDYKEVYEPFSSKDVKTQASRCMDCGVPLCHNACPVNNIIPEWNHLVYENRFEDARLKLTRTNNFPDVTGRVCPAPCESDCILGITKPAVAIKAVEKKIADRAWKEGRYKPQLPEEKSGQKVAVIGSGPAGLACAQQLTREGHDVTVYEKWDKAGGLLRYGIPDFKLEKWVIDRNVELMEKEGTKFVYNTHIGVDKTWQDLKDKFDAVVLCTGSEKPRDLPVKGRELKGTYFAMEFLPLQNKLVAGQKVAKDKMISAKDKTVVIIGGGDTGADCLGTSIRQGAKKIYQFEIMPKPDPERRSTSHDEGGERRWAVETLELFGDKDGSLKRLKGCEVKWTAPKKRGERPSMERISGSEFEIEVDMILLAMGYLHPVHEGLVQQLGCDVNERGNLKVDKNFMTSVDGVFAAGDCEMGQSLVVWAIRRGRDAAARVHHFLAEKKKKSAAV